jgi:hypothetical protein
MTQSTHDDNDSPLAGVDLHVWRVPPPGSIDREALLGRALAPAIAPPKTTRLRWILVAIVVINAAIATLIVILTRPTPESTTVALPAGGGDRKTLHELLRLIEQQREQQRRAIQELEQQRRELERMFAELDKKQEQIDQLLRDIEAYEREPRVPAPPPRRTNPPPRRPERPERIERKAVPPEALEGVPDLDRVAISTTINAIKPQIVACGARSTMKGKIRARVRVAPDGSVLSVSIDEADDDMLAACVANVIQRARFPQTKGGSFSYPFIF